MTKFMQFIGTCAITAIYIEGVLIFDEWRKQVKIETERKQKELDELEQLSVDDISEEICNIKDQLAGLKIKAVGGVNK